MSDPVRIVVVAEAVSDAAVIRALVEKVAALGHGWVRDLRDAYGDLRTLVCFQGEAGMDCITHGRVKSLAALRRIRLTGRGEAAAARLVRKCVAVCRTIDRDAPIVFHHDAEDLSGATADEVRARCADLGVVAALPNPCTESWVLRLAKMPAPPTCREAKQAVGDHGLVPGDVIDAADLGSVPSGADGLRAFLDDAGHALVPLITRGHS